MLVSQPVIPTISPDSPSETTKPLASLNGKKLSFFTAVDYPATRLDSSRRAIRNIDDYFYLGGRKAQVVNVESKKRSVVEMKDGYSSNWFMTTLKIASYFTLVIPAIMLFAKLIARSQVSYYIVEADKPPKQHSSENPKSEQKHAIVDKKINSSTQLNKPTTPKIPSHNVNFNNAKIQDEQLKIQKVKQALKAIRRQKKETSEVAFAEKPISQTCDAELNFNMNHFKSPPECLWNRQKAAFGKMIHLQEQLGDKYYTFTHGSSLDIAFMHDVLTSIDHAEIGSPFKVGKIAHKRFRVPGIGIDVPNVYEFMKTYEFPNSLSNVKDNDHPESFISVDGYHYHTDAAESALYFFTRNKSVLTRKNSMKTADENPILKSLLLSSPIKNNKSFSFLIKKMVLEQIKKIQDINSPGGKLYLMAVKKEVIDDKNTNYAWRAHPFGYICKCQDENDEYKHETFTKVLAENNVGFGHICIKGNGINQTPQYRLLARNFEQDQEKQIYTFDVMTEQERQTYNTSLQVVNHIIKTCIRIDSINDATSQETLESTLLRIDLNHPENDYHTGVRIGLVKKKAFILRHLQYLKNNLPPQHLTYLKKLLKI